MEIKILQVFYGKDGLPYKDKDRQVHFPIAGTGFLGASNTTKIKFYYDELDNLDETTWVAVSKLPNGKVGSRVLESYLDEELNEHYALLELDNYYTQYKGDVFISLQGYQGGVDFDYDEENSQYEIHGTPTIAATGSIKFTINYANQFVGSDETDNINFQRILAILGTKLGMRAYSEHVEELPSEGNPNIFYVVNDDPTNPIKQNIYIWNAETRHYIWVGDNTLYLGNYYTAEQGEGFEEQIENRVESVESELESVASGSPSGVYATVSDLTTANPDHSKIYLVTADGKWYYYNTSTSSWTAGGTYQSTGIADHSINVDKVDNTIFGNGTNIANQYASVTDLNNCELNRLYMISWTSAGNLPVAEVGWCLCVGRGADYVYQIYTTMETKRRYYRVKMNGPWSSWNCLATGTKKVFSTGQTITSPYNDFNSIPSETTVRYDISISSVSNKPVDIYGTLYCFGASDYAKFQIYVPMGSPLVYFRSCQSSTWTSWNSIATTADINDLLSLFGETVNVTYTENYFIQANGEVVSHNSFKYSSPFYLEKNTLLYVKARGYLTAVSIIAKTNSSGSTYTNVVHSDNSVYHWYKYVIQQSGYYAVCGNKDSEIIIIKNESFVNLGKEETSSINMFEKIAVIGDSYASGVIFLNSVDYYQKYYLSWIQMIARRNGITAQNYSTGGLTTRTWLTNESGLAKMLNAEPDNLYILALGINDGNNLGLDYLGSISDINDSDPTQNADTFYGNYGKIIANVKTHSPNAKIIMSTMATNATEIKIAYNSAIVEIANHYNIPVIYQYNDYYFKSSNYLNTMVGGHPTAIGYGEMSKALERMVDACISDNRSYFNNYVGN